MFKNLILISLMKEILRSLRFLRMTNQPWLLQNNNSVSISINS